MQGHKKNQLRVVCIAEQKETVHPPTLAGGTISGSDSRLQVMENKWTPGTGNKKEVRRSGRGEDGVCRNHTARQPF